MRQTTLMLQLLGLAALVMPTEAFAIGEAAEVEAARHQVRAGGPTNDRDRDLLSRYGCFTDADSAFCARASGHQQNGTRSRVRRYNPSR